MQPGDAVGGYGYRSKINKVLFGLNDIPKRQWQHVGRPLSVFQVGGIWQISIRPIPDCYLG
jgi:hypothetical protein